MAAKQLSYGGDARGKILDTPLGELLLRGPRDQLFTLEEIEGPAELSRYPEPPK